MKMIHVSNHARGAALLAILLCAGVAAAEAEAKTRHNLANIDQLTEEALAAMLPEKPLYFGAPASDRGFWRPLAEKYDPEPLRRRVAKDLPKAAGQKAPNLYAHIIGRALLLDCMAGDDEYLPAIRRLVDDVLERPLWIGENNGHWRDGVFVQTGNHHTTTELASMLALADRLLEDKLPPATRQKIRDEIRRRLFDPYLEDARAVEAGEERGGFFAASNLNAVCHLYLAECAAILLESRQERAKFLHSAIRQVTRRYLPNAFYADGGTHEGMHYWFYGFNHYAKLAELILLQTGGKVDLLNGSEHADKIERLPLDFWLDGFFPAFADSRLDTSMAGQPALPILTVRAGMGDYIPFWHPWSPLDRGYPHSVRRILTVNHALRDFIPPTPPAPNASDTPGADESAGGGAAPSAAESLVRYFPDGGYLISRPGRPGGLSLAFKGGVNHGPHNHNDAGSFVIGLGGVPVVTDPGWPQGSVAELYSGKRYQNDFLNSHGHPVPVVAGKLQGLGEQYRAVIHPPEIGAERVAAVLDLKGAYPDDVGAEKLERNFLHDRRTESVALIDEADFAEPSAFGAALTGYGEIVESAPGIWRFTYRGQTVRAEIRAEAGELKFNLEALKGRSHAATPAYRLGYEAVEPAKRHRLTVTFTPEEPSTNQAP